MAASLCLPIAELQAANPSLGFNTPPLVGGAVKLPGWCAQRRWQCGSMPLYACRCQEGKGLT